MGNCHSHKVHETRKRSLAKTVSFRIIEILVDILVLYIILLSGLPALAIASIGAITVEMTCGIGYYLWERLWNKIHWGRNVEEIEKKEK